jgi:hypothetical protein
LISITRQSNKHCLFSVTAAICPLSNPVTFDLVVNLITAKALGLDYPANAGRPRRRGDRIRLLFAATAHGRLWHNAEVPRRPLLRRYQGRSGHQTRPEQAP